MPTVLSKILEENADYREIVLSQCSAFDLLRFSGSNKLVEENRAMRNVAHEVLGRRRLNLLFHAIDDRNCEIRVDENGSRRETLSVIEAKPNKREDVRSGSPHSDDDSEDVPFEERKLSKYVGVLAELARHSHIRLLEFRQDRAHIYTITEGFRETRVILKEGKDLFRVDTLKFALSEDNNEVLRFFVPRVLEISSNGYGYHLPNFSSHFGPHGTFNHIGFVCAEELHIDERERKDIHSPQPMEVGLPSVRATIIDLSLYSRISTLSVIHKVNMWKWGVQPMRWLTCCVGLREDPDWFKRGPTDPVDIDAFCVRLLETLADSTEMPYPSDDNLPAGVLDHMRRTEQIWNMNKEKMPRAIHVPGQLGNLVIVVRQFTWDEPPAEVRRMLGGWTTDGKIAWDIVEVGGGVKPALALGAFHVVD